MILLAISRPWLFGISRPPIDAERLECGGEGPGGKSGFPPWSRRIVRRRREIRIRRLGSQAPLWYLSRQTPDHRKSSGSNPGMPEIAVRPSDSRSDLTMLRRSVKVRRHEPMRPFSSSASVWRKAYQSGACETTRGIRFSLRHHTISLVHGGNPDSPGASRRRTPNAPRQSAPACRRIN